jgi:high-affinity nickel-transport protein
MLKWIIQAGRQRPGMPDGRIRMLYLFLAGANVLVWGWAWFVLGEESSLLGTALMAYSFGLRHALDADHIAAIDNVTRRLMQDGERPVLLGFFFALGHSLVVILVSLVVAYMATSAVSYLPRIQQVGALVSTSISTMFLTAIGLLNLWMFTDIYRSLQKIRRGEHDSVKLPGHGHQHGGLLSRLCQPLFGRVHRSWQMVPLGFLFGLGFETATEVALLSTAAVQASQGLGLAVVLLFPALFTVGMLTVDTTDGVLMLRVYGWAFVQPLRKLYYNLVLTLISTLVALVIAGVNVASLLQEHFRLGGRFWQLVQQAHENYGVIGYIIAGLFALSWLGSNAFYRMRKHDLVGIDKAAVAAGTGP